MTGRGKHLWSIYEKMVQKGREFDEIFDLVGMRIIVEDERDCWAALGAIHALWTLQGLGALDDATHQAALLAKDARLRRNATERAG